MVSIGPGASSKPTTDIIANSRERGPPGLNVRMAGIRMSIAHVGGIMARDRSRDRRWVYPSKKKPQRKAAVRYVRYNADISRWAERSA